MGQGISLVFSLWNLIKGSLYKQQETEKAKLSGSERRRLERWQASRENVIIPSAPPEELYCPSDDNNFLPEGDFEEDLQPNEVAELEEEPDQHYSERYPPIQAMHVKKRKPWQKEIKRLKYGLEEINRKIGALTTRENEAQSRTPTPSLVEGLGPPPGNATVSMAQKARGPFPLSTVRTSVSALQASSQEARQNGEDISEFYSFPVLEQPDGQGNMVRVHAPISFKQIRELKSSCSQYGPIAPFTLALLESMSTEALCPGDWKQLARACLSGDNLLRKSDFAEHCLATAELNRAQQIPITYDMLAGEGIYREIGQQLDFDVAVYAQVNTAAQRAWNKLPQAGRQVEDLSKIYQGPDELFQDFVARLMQAANRLISDEKSGLLLVKQLA